MASLVVSRKRPSAFMAEAHRVIIDASHAAEESLWKIAEENSRK